MLVYAAHRLQPTGEDGRVKEKEEEKLAKHRHSSVVQAARQHAEDTSVSKCRDV